MPDYALQIVPDSGCVRNGHSRENFHKRPSKGKLLAELSSVRSVSEGQLPRPLSGVHRLSG